MERIDCFQAEAAIYPGLKGKAALVTGATGGIGRDTAILLAKNGVRLYLTGRNSGALHELKEKMDLNGYECVIRQSDVTKEEDVKSSVRECVDRYGRIDILCNVAGGSLGLPRDTAALSLNDWNAVLALNMGNVFLHCREALPYMKQQKYGRIINVSSLAGEVAGETVNVAYASAKAGIIQFTRHLAREIGDDGITVNAVSPGYTASSERIEKLWEVQQMDRIINRLAIKRSADPAEQARVLVFLASDEAGYITGEVIDVNGGAFVG